MSFTESEIKAIEEAHILVNRLLTVLEEQGFDRDEFQYFRKVFNITHSKDPKGMRNVQHHLYVEGRILDETGLSNDLSDPFDEVFDELYKFTREHDIFRRS